MKQAFGCPLLLASCLALLMFSNCRIGSADEGSDEVDGEPLIYAHRFSIESKVLGEKRSYLVVKPTSYKHTRKKYPVLFLLDGDAHALHTAGVIQFLATNQKIPEMIIVAIPNTDRTRDLTPPTHNEKDQERFPTSGGADAFLEFVNDELRPAIESDYRVADYSLLVGHSFGGLFAIHAMVNRPGSFDAYLAISPSLWWNDQAIVEQAKEQLPQTPDETCQLYMTLGNEGGMMRAGFFSFAGVMEQFAGNQRRWAHHNLDAETHGSVPLRSTYLGLEYLFTDWRITNAPELFEAGGLKLVEQRLDRARVRFKDLVDTDRAYDAIVDRLLKQQELTRCRELIEALADRYQPLPRQWFALGEAYREQDEQAAEACYRETLRLQPSHEQAQDKLRELGVSEPGVNWSLEIPTVWIDQLVGSYAITPNDDLIHIRSDGNGVTVQINDQAPEELRRIADTRLFFSKSDIEIEFTPVLEDDASVGEDEAIRRVDTIRIKLPRDEVLGHRCIDEHQTP